MTHEPECEPWRGPSLECICDNLRAMRERTLTAARDAVAALPHDTYCASLDKHFRKRCNCPHDDALAAIDALKNHGVSSA